MTHPTSCPNETGILFSTHFVRLRRAVKRVDVPVHASTNRALRKPYANLNHFNT